MCAATRQRSHVLRSQLLQEAPGPAEGRLHPSHPDNFTSSQGSETCASPLRWKPTQRSRAGSQGPEPRPAQERRPANTRTGRKRAPDLCPPLPGRMPLPIPRSPPCSLPPCLTCLGRPGHTAVQRSVPEAALPEATRDSDTHPHPDRGSLKKSVCPGQEGVLFFLILTQGYDLIFKKLLI